MEQASEAPPEAKRLLVGYIPETEFAAELGITVRTARQWRQRREGPPFVRIGTAIFYEEAAVRRWLKSLETATVSSRRAG